MDDPDALLAAASDLPRSPLEVSLAATHREAQMLFVSGQVASRDGGLIAEGLVGRDVNLALAQECARQCARNVLSVVQKELGSLTEVDGVVRLGVYVSSADGFTDQHLVAHGASQLVCDVLGDRGQHTRTAIGVRALPLNSPVEVDAIFKIRTGDATE